jgi:hypothetical protein
MAFSSGQLERCFAPQITAFRTETSLIPQQTIADPARQRHADDGCFQGMENTGVLLVFSGLCSKQVISRSGAALRPCNHAGFTPGKPEPLFQ